MNRKLIIAIIWLIALGAIFSFANLAQNYPSFIEEVLWLSVAVSVIVHFYSPKFSGAFAIGWSLFAMGQLFDILDNFDATHSLFINALDTPLKNIGLIFIIFAMVRLLEQRNEMIAQLNAEIEAKEALQAQLTFDAFHDPLTHLGNRRACFEYFETMLDKYESLYYFDLDNFKAANDKHGHLVGDNILKLFTKALTHEFGEQNCFRLGGDEFVAFGEDVIVNDAFRAKLLHDLNPFNVGVSIGVTKLNRNQSADTLLNIADHQMYNDKSHKIFRSSRRQ